MNVLNLTKAAKGIIMTAAAALLLAGCGEGVYALPEDAPRIEQSTYVNEKDKDDTYQSLNVGGREYVFYGGAKESVKDADVRACAGYTDDEKKERVYSLAGTGDYIMLRYINGWMDEPAFYRAEDTIGKDIYTPPFIRCFEFKLWDNESGV